VLGWVVADHAYRAYVDLAEGKLTDLRKAVVNAMALAQAADEIGLGAALLLGKGEASAGGRNKPSILSDALEAVFGAVYLDGGAEDAYRVITTLLGPRLADAINRLGVLDHKTSLQELSARLHEAPPVYTLREEGPDHAKRFFAEVRVNGDVWGAGEGRSKKQAEQAAAREACAAMLARAGAGADADAG
jgi:ribonuclease III